MIRLAGKFNALETGGLFFAGLCFILCMFFLEKHSMRAVLVLEISAAEKSTFQIFWRQSSEFFTEKNSQTIRLRPSQDTYTIVLPQIIGVDYLRFDPLDKPASLQIKVAKLILPGDRALDLLPVITNNAIELQEIVFSPDMADGTLHMSSLGMDPSFSVSLKEVKLWNFGWKVLIAGLAVPVLLGVIFRQDLLKGSRRKGILTLSLPQGATPGMSAVGNMSSVGVRHEKRNGRSLYWLDVRGIEEHSLTDLVMDLKRDNPGATIRFQYNRAGEV